MATTSFQADLLAKHRGLAAAWGTETDYGAGEAARDLLATVAAEEMAAKVRAMAAGVDEEGMDGLGGDLGIDPPLSLLPFHRLDPSPSKPLFHSSSALSQRSSCDSLQCSRFEPHAPPVCGTLPAGLTASKYHRLSPPHLCSPCRRFTKSPLS
jgi:hypothetical protein